MKEYTLPEGWKYVPLGTIADVINGVSFKPEDVKKQGIRILRSGNIQNGYLVLKDDDVFLDDSYYNEKNTLRYLDNCITASTGSIEVLGKCGTVFKEMPNCQIGAFMRLVRSKAKENAFYISFILHSPLYYQYIRRLSKNGTSINNINNNHLEDFIFPLPPQKLKEGISRWYYSIEKKISLNTRMNAELEAMAKQLYDYWFVQFDFPDKNGKPYKSSGGKMVWNEKLKREIPEGWEVVELKSVLDNTINATFPGVHLRGLAYCPIDEIPIRKMSFAGGKSWEEALSSLQLYNEKNILIGAMRVYFHRCCISSSSGITRTTTIVLTPKEKEHLSYCYQICNEERTFEFAIKESNGTQQPYVTWNSLSKYLFPYPKEERIINQYCEKTNRIIVQVLNNVVQSNQLTILRDSLLPMLMNGQVTIE